MENDVETNPMNRDIFAGKWKQIRGDLKTWWGKLTDDDFDRIDGQRDKLIGLLQERYGYTRDQAEQEVQHRLQEYGAKTSCVVGSLSARAREFGATATKKANQAAPVIGEKMKSVADMIRKKAPREGTIGTAATRLSSGLESASDYLKEKKFDYLGEDLKVLVSRYPVRSLIVGLGLGFWLAKHNRNNKHR